MTSMRGYSVSVQHHFPASRRQLCHVNHFTNLFQDTAGPHPAAIQFWTLSFSSLWTVDPHQLSSMEVPPLSRDFSFGTVLPLPGAPGRRNVRSPVGPAASSHSPGLVAPPVHQWAS